MADPSGIWECEVDTPMGAQSFTLLVRAEGDRFEGKASGTIGSMKIDGNVDDDAIAWTMAVPKPMPVTLTCRATITGDALEGRVKAGIFGSYPITGTRTAAA